VTPDELARDLNVLGALSGLVAVAWLLAALTTMAGSREARRGFGALLAAAFLLLALAAAGEAWFAAQTAREVAVMRTAAGALLERTVFYRLQLVGLQMVGAFAVLVLFRARR